MKREPLYKTAEDFITRTIVGETILIPVGKAAQKLNGMASFSETGQFLWKLMKEKSYSKAELVSALAIECNCNPDEIVSDVDEYLQNMLKHGFIICDE